METEPTLSREIRITTTDDVRGLRKVQALSWLATYPNEEMGVPYEWVKQRTDSWLEPDMLTRSNKFLESIFSDESHFHKVAIVNKEIAGFVHVSSKDDGTKELEAIYVAPDQFGSGLGQALMNQANYWIGKSQSVLTVATYNSRAIRFYEKNGYRKVQGSEHLYADKIPVINMLREGVKHEI